ncbi:dTDP-glucose 4,6-dehydratase [Devosia sp. A449]
MRALVTGGAGFIGSALCRHLMQDPNNVVVVLDKLTYAGNLQLIAALRELPNFTFVRGDIGDGPLVSHLLAHHRIDHIIHLAAETHVDRSIDAPGAFIETNVVGTYALLHAALKHWQKLPPRERTQFRFHHVSTDEVFGDLPFDGSLFSETTPYAPSSPYSASKAASDHLVRAWHHTYGLPVVLSNCSNNYGPYHFPEKLIPLMILNALAEQPLPVYGTGSNVRDWLYVYDHARALALVSARGTIGESYNIGGKAECSNLDIVEQICALLDKRSPREDGSAYAELVNFVTDRPGHDRRYAMDISKIERDLGWTPQETLQSGLGKTVDWYLDNANWWRPLQGSGEATARRGVALSP